MIYFFLFVAFVVLKEYLMGPKATKTTTWWKTDFFKEQNSVAVILKINYMDMISWAWKSALPCSSWSKGFDIILQSKKIEATVIQLVWHTWYGQKFMTNCKFLCLISFTNLSKVFNMYNMSLIFFVYWIYFMSAKDFM